MNTRNFFHFHNKTDRSIHHISVLNRWNQNFLCMLRLLQKPFLKVFNHRLKKKLSKNKMKDYTISLILICYFGQNLDLQIFMIRNTNTLLTNSKKTSILIQILKFTNTSGISIHSIRSTLRNLVKFSSQLLSKKTSFFYYNNIDNLMKREFCPPI